MPGFNPVPSSIQISRMLRRPPPVSGIAFKSGVSQHPFPLKRQSGGGIPDSPSHPVIGAINTNTPGRADAHPTHVPPGSYVMPADIVGMMGEGNTAAGQAILAKMFLPLQAQEGKQIALMAQGAPYGATGGPYGTGDAGLRPTVHPPPRPPAPYDQTPAKLPSFGIAAMGGVVPPGPPAAGPRPGTPINISGGEFVIPPNEVKRRGRGDINRGHEILDAWVKALRAEHIKTLKRLPGPAQ